MKPQIAVLEGLAEEGRNGIAQFANVVEFEANRPTITGLIIRSKTKVDHKFLAQLPKLKALVSATVGFDHIDLRACQERSIRVAHCPNSHTEAAGQLSFAFLLSLSRNLGQAQAALNSADWKREPLRGFELENKTLGIIGFGRIGKNLARKAAAFALKVCAYDPYVDDDVFSKNGVSRIQDLNLLLQASDIVSLHVPLTTKTRKMLGKSELQKMKPHAILLNTSRGAAIDEGALAEHAALNPEFKFALDVYSEEPLPIESELLRVPHTQRLLTPHIGAQTHEALVKVSLEAANGLKQLLLGQTCDSELPPKASWFELT